MIKNYFFLLASMLVGLAASSQSFNRFETGKHNFYFSIPLKYSYTNLQGINQRMQELGTKGISQSSVEAGLGLRYSYKRFGIGYDMFLLGGNTSNFSRTDVRGNQSSSQFFVSYNVIHNSKYIIFPQVGYSAASSVITISHNNSSMAFNQALSGTGNATMVYNTNNYLSFSVGIIGNSTKKRAKANGLIIGYNLPLTNNQWQLTSGTTTNSPADNMGSLYMQFTVGINQKK